MKKKIIILLCATFSFMLLTTNIKAVDTKATEEQIRAFVYTFDNIESTVKYVRDLKDINGNTSFSLYEIEGKGFAVTVKDTGNIVDVVYDDIPDESKLYYVGPNTFVESNTSKGRSAIDSEEVKESTENILNEKKTSFTLENIQSKARKVDLNNKPSAIVGGTEVGITDSRMNLFDGSWWVNKQTQCGAYVGAAMVTYMDKYWGGSYIDEYKPINNEKPYCDYIVSRFLDRIPGKTFSYGLINAINSVMMADYPRGGKTADSTATESVYKSKIAAGRPVILALSEFKNSPYGSHFVLAFKYVDYKGSLWFKAYDNWSRTQNRGWINRNWVQDGIFLN